MGIHITHRDRKVRLAGAGMAAQLHRLGEGNLNGSKILGINVREGHLRHFFVIKIECQHWLSGSIIYVKCDMVLFIGICPALIIALHFADIKASTNKILNLNCRSGDGQRALIGTCAICLNLDTALNIRIFSSINNVIDRFKFEGFLAGGTCTRLLHNFGKMDFIHRVRRIHGNIRSLLYETIR